jgi:hypothetical protein
VDGVGEWAPPAIAHGKGRDIPFLRELDFPHSLGLLYSAFTYYCGFKVNYGEYKLMGLAPYGIEGGERVERYKKAILDELVDLREDGSLLLNMDYFDYATGLTMTRDAKWEALFSLPRRAPESELGQEHMDMALAIQQVTEEAVMRLARTARDLTGCRNLTMAGGVALNCVANGKPASRISTPCATRSADTWPPATPWAGSRAAWNTAPGHWADAASWATRAIPRCRKSSTSRSSTARDSGPSRPRSCPKRSRTASSWTGPRPTCSWWPRWPRPCASPCPRATSRSPCSRGSTSSAPPCRPSPTWTSRPGCRPCTETPTNATGG